MLRLIFVSLCVVAIQCAIQSPENSFPFSRSCSEVKHNILNKPYVCEVTWSATKSVGSCKGFEFFRENMIPDISVIDHDGVLYTIKDNKVYAINTDGRIYTIVLGLQSKKYSPIVMKMNQQKNILLILASASQQCPQEGGLFVLKTDRIVPNMLGQIVIFGMEDLGDKFRWLKVSEHDEIELLIDEENKLTLNPNSNMLNDKCLEW